MISIKSLRVDYDNTTAVFDLNFDIKAGQIFGLVGPNGAGKTSTIKAIAGIIEPTYGEIVINGIDFELHPQQALQQIGYMPDFPPLYENLKVWEYLDVFGAAYLIDSSRRREKSEYWIGQVNLTEKWDAYIKDLSRGMRQRLVLAKTLLHDPKVLLLDEPASGLDPVARKEMQDVLRKVAGNDKAILISSHILTELSDYCNAVGIMEKGRMVVSGDINDIRQYAGAKAYLEIKILENNVENIERLMKMLSEIKYLKDITLAESRTIKANFTGTESEASSLLVAIIRENIGVSDFHVKEANVEDIFFKIGATQVS